MFRLSPNRRLRMGANVGNLASARGGLPCQGVNHAHSPRLAKAVIVGLTAAVLGALSCSSDAPTSAEGCIVVHDALQRTQTVRVRVGDSTLVRTIEVSDAGATIEHIQIAVHGLPYLTARLALARDGSADAEAVQEGVASHLTSANGTDWTGSIDGSALMPFHLEGRAAVQTVLHYADGREITGSASSEETQKVISALAAATNTATEHCVETTGSTGSVVMDAVPPVHENPLLSRACRDAVSGCRIGYGLCVGLGTGACIGLLFIPFVGAALFALCEVAIFIGCTVQLTNCTKQAQTGTNCCPVPCGGTDENHCCNAGSTCFDPTSGLCCPQTHPHICGNSSNGGVCCLEENREACVGGGGSHPICCPRDAQHQACGDVACCDVTTDGPCLQDAFGGPSECCPPDRACNTICCNNGFACNVTTRTCECGQGRFCGLNCCNIGENCINAAKGTCCKAGNSVCGGGCCPNSAACGADGNCCPKAQACGLSCCPNGSKCAGASGGTPSCCPNANTVCGNECCGNAAACVVSTGGSQCCGSALGSTPCGSSCCTGNTTCIDPTTGACGP